MELSAQVSAANTSVYKCLMFCESTRSCLTSNALLINNQLGRKVEEDAS